MDIVREALASIIETVLLSGLIYLLIINLGGRKIPSRFRKKLFVIITVVLLIGLINCSLGSFIAKVFLTALGTYWGIKFLYE